MWWMAVAAAHTCGDIAPDEITSVEAPAVIVLGERHGEKVDMKRAWSVVSTLAKEAPVTLAMEALHESNQGVMDRYAEGVVKTGKLADELHWGDTWGFSFKPYKKLVTSSKKGVTVVAAGLDLGPKPEGREIPIPEGYREFLMEGMKEHAHMMSEEVRARFHVSMAWRDFRIGELAAEAWSGEGYLVVLVGRGHVEAGMGTNWQLEQLVDAPVISVVLNHEDAQCFDGDRVWAD